MKILIVSEHYWPEQFRVTDLAEGLHARGHEVDVLTGMPSYPEGRHFEGYRPWGPFRQEHGGVRLKRVPIIPRGKGRSWQLALNYLSFLVSGTLRLLLRRRRPWDVVLVYQPSPVTTAVPALIQRAMAGIPVAIWVQDLWPESITAAGMMRSPWLASLVERLSRTIYGSCDLVLGQSRAIAARLVESGVARERIGYLPNWAEDLYRPTSRSIQVPEAWEQGFCLMFAGNLGRVQALDTLLDAVKLTQDDSAIHWVFLGDGPLRAWLGEEARRRGLSRVHLLGRRPVTEMPAFFSRAHAMLVSLKPDQTMALTVPTKLQSYLACGRPVVASLDGEGARVVVESGAGFAAPAGDADALARAVRKMKGLTSLEREERGRAGRDYYLREFDRPRCLDSAEAFLGKLTSERKAQASSARP